jgi:hypothetical protein
MDLPSRKESPMRATVSGLAALVVVLALSSAAQAQHHFCHGCGCPPLASNAFTPCYFGYNYWGTPYFGPNVIGPPPGMPFNGMLPPPNWNSGDVQMYATHPYARSPRDYFMLNLR